MKNIKIDPAGILAKLAQNKEKAHKNERKTIPINENKVLKVEGPGDYLFRAVPYIHNSDPTTEPFIERYYHFGLPGGTIYCPKMNAGQECSICEYCWSQMKEHKGTETVKVFSDKLPKKRIGIVGQLRGERSQEGVKFFMFGSSDKRMSDNHEKLYKWFEKKGTASWLDLKEGLDMIITYEEYEDQKAKLLNTKFGLKDIDLDRDVCPLGTDDEIEEFLESVPNIDESDDPSLEGFKVKTTEDSTTALNKWLQFLNRKTRDDKSTSFNTAELEAKTEQTTTEEETSETEEVPQEAKSSLKKRLNKLMNKSS